MNKLIIASAAAALMIGSSGLALAATPENCQALFQKADLNKDGALQSEESKVFLDAMNQAQVKPADVGMIKQDEFMMACEKDAFASIDPASIGTAQSTAAQAEQPATNTDQSAQSTDTATTTDPAAPATTAEQTTTTTTDPAQPAAQDPAAIGEAAQPLEQTGEQALAVPEAFMASDLIGATLYSANNENIGEVKDIILAQEGGQATHAIVDAGDKDVAVELSKLEIAATDDGFKVMMNAGQAELQAMPAVQTNQ
jgi:hypothetical protein